jgi:hypothetical protein
MRLIVLGAMQFIFWSAFYTLTPMLKDERLTLAAFVVTLVISMVTASVFLAKPR